MTTTDHFAQKAQTYEHNPNRVDNVQNIADAITSTLSLTPDMHLMDFGSGTGLLLERIAPHVAKITAVDISPAMNAQLAAKRENLGCDLAMREIDLEKDTLDDTFDGIISSMTMHHVQDIPAMLAKFNALLNPGGFIALADLDSEDGSFHGDNDTGVYHQGFAREAIAEQAREAGFNDVTITTASVVHKDSGDFSVFLLTGRRD